MAGKAEIEFIIKPDGTVEEQVRGVAGPECEDITRGIERALGEVAEREHTSEYYDETESAGDHVTTSS
jgi:hypothetical protein